MVQIDIAAGLTYEESSACSAVKNSSAVVGQGRESRRGPGQPPGYDALSR